MIAHSPSTLLHVESTDHAAGAVLRCAGDIDLSSAAYLERALAASIATGTPVLEVDLREVRYFDSSAIKALLNAQDALAAGGRRMTVRVQPSARALLRVLKLDRVLDVQPD